MADSYRKSTFYIESQLSIASWLLKVNIPYRKSIFYKNKPLNVDIL